MLIFHTSCVAYAPSTEADLFADQVGVFEIATSNKEKYMRQVLHDYL